MDKSNNGVIYMAMGSVLKGSSFPIEAKKSFLKVFSEIPQQVIWKYEEELEIKSNNILIVKWAPQKELLCKFVF